MIFVDTGGWYASIVPTDPNHASARQWEEVNDEALVTRDYVIDELYTLLLSKVVMGRLGIKTAFAFDRHFRQFGSVSVVPG